MSEPSSSPTATTSSPRYPVSARAARPPARFTAKELVSVAIFAVLYVVIVFAVSMLGVISPLVMVLTLPLTPIVAGIPYMLFTTRVRHLGLITLFGTVVALAFLAFGQPWQSTLVTILCAALADLVLARGRYRSRWSAIWSHTVLSAWFIGPWIPFFLDRDAYFAGQATQSMGSDYVAAMDTLLSAPIILGMWVVTLVCGFLGGLLGSAMLSKHFRKAGLA